jgi:hypothetical protein
LDEQLTSDIHTIVNFLYLELGVATLIAMGVLVWGIAMTTRSVRIDKLVGGIPKMATDISECLAMHKNPERHGFGTGATNKLIEQQTVLFAELSREATAAVDRQTEMFSQLVHYLKVNYRNQHNGAEPPAKMPGG